jgi:hypothetical protein
MPAVFFTVKIGPLAEYWPPHEMVATRVVPRATHVPLELLDPLGHEGPAAAVAVAEAAVAPPLLLSLLQPAAAAGTRSANARRMGFVVMRGRYRSSVIQASQANPRVDG